MSKLIFLATWLLAGCVTVDSISVSQVPAQDARKKIVKASASRPVILLIPFGTSFVEEARKDLQAQCPNGDIEGLVSKQESVAYPFVSISRLNLRGYCVEKDSKSSKAT